jgi:hypothetical protein
MYGIDSTIKKQDRMTGKQRRLPTVNEMAENLGCTLYMTANTNAAVAWGMAP